MALCISAKTISIASADDFIKLAQTYSAGDECVLKNDIDFVLIDLRYGLSEDGVRGVSLDDSNSVGVKAFDIVENECSNLPVYIIESGDELLDSDREVYQRNGAAGFVSLKGASDSSVSRQLHQISEEIEMEKKGRYFGKKGYGLEYNTAQIADNSVLKIQ